MGELKINVKRVTECYFELEIYLDEIYIGKYERSIEREIERKKQEIQNAKEYLQRVFHEHNNQPFCIKCRRNDKKKMTKLIIINNNEVDTIPEKFWEKPSWK